MSKPIKHDLVNELRRLKTENERLRRLVATQRPELERLRDIEVGLRDYLDNGAEELVRIHGEVKALLQGEDDLPSLNELCGINSDGKARVDALLQCQHPSLVHGVNGETTCLVCGTRMPVTTTAWGGDDTEQVGDCAVSEARPTRTEGGHGS